MTQEEKKLLLVDLCARLPFKVKVCLYEKETCILMGINGHEVYLDVDSDSFRIESIKPYLRPMSSMTEEEYDELCELANSKFIGDSKEIDWLNKKMFDYRGLIPMGLALEAPEEMYNVTK
jgi:hypothetical protein